MKSCLTCDLLGTCEMATEEMLRNNKGCASWEEAIKEVTKARRKARDIAGAQALQEMLKTPPDKLIK